MSYCKTFEEWENTAEVVAPSVEIGRKGQRSFWLMRGHNVSEDTFFSRNWLKPVVSRFYLTDFNILYTDPLAELARRFGGEWTDDGWYSEDGRGGLVFENARQCWDFLVEMEKQKAKIMAKDDLRKGQEIKETWFTMASPDRPNVLSWQKWPTAEQARREQQTLTGGPWRTMALVRVDRKIRVIEDPLQVQRERLNDEKKG